MKQQLRFFLSIFIIFCLTFNGIEPNIAFADLVKGIDVSEWQGDIDWDKVKQSEIKFAMLRCGYGINDPKQRDKKFDRNVREAQRLGIDYGVYHFSYATSVSRVEKEAEFCLELLKDYKPTYPIVLDMECSKYTQNLDKRTLTDMCARFCDKIEKAGYYAMIYMNYNWATTRVFTNELFSRYDLWLAQWEVDKPSLKCGIWQHSSNGSINGILEKVDLNFSYKDYPTIIKNNHLNKF